MKKSDCKEFKKSPEKNRHVQENLNNKLEKAGKKEAFK